MLRFTRTFRPSPKYFNYSSVRYYRTRTDLIVSQDKGSMDCTRASIATILNHAKKQKFYTVNKVNEYLLWQCEAYRAKGIDGLQPAMELKAAKTLFEKYGLFTLKLNYNAEMLLSQNTVESLRSALKGGMILASCQPPGNSELVSHSVVITDIVHDQKTQQIVYCVYDPYPRPDRDSDGIRQLSVHDVIKERLSAEMFVASL